MNQSRYKRITITIEGSGGDDDHIQDYVVESSVTVEQLMGGDDTGVVCLCLQAGKAETIMELLNTRTTH